MYGVLYLLHTIPANGPGTCAPLVTRGYGGDILAAAASPAEELSCD